MTTTAASRPRQRTRSTEEPRPLALAYTLLLATALLGATLYGLLVEDAYRVADEVAAQGRGQDLLTLLTIPLLVGAAVRARAGDLRAHVLWLGLLLYIAYTYASYAFGVPFNDVFLLYVAALGLSSYGLLDGLLRLDSEVVAPAFERAPLRLAGTVLLVFGSLFALVWLSDIVPALPGGLPESRMAYDLPNPIHVLDLAWLVPAVLTVGVQLRRSRPAAGVITGVLLVKLVTLSLAIVFMGGFMLLDGEALDPVVTTLFVVLGIAAAWLVIAGRRGLGAVRAPWMRATIWPHAHD